MVAVSVCTFDNYCSRKLLMLLNYLYFMFIADHHDLPLDVASCFRLKCLDTLPETRVGICSTGALDMGGQDGQLSTQVLADQLILA